MVGFLGKGGMARVFRIEYPFTGKVGALKLLDPEPLLTSLVGEDRVEELFTREALTMAKIRHPNVLEVIDFDRADGRLYYTMDFHCNNLGQMIGESYETEKPSRKIVTDKVFLYAKQILEGLACLHWSNLIHRDIKPFNIMITELDTVKIGDFGLSKLRGEAFGGHKSLKVGSPYYTAPEQENDPESADFKSDLYSAGVMIYRMVTGRLPLDPFVKPSTLNRDLDEKWDDFLAGALALDPESRYRSADDMAADLAGLEKDWHERKERICAVPEVFLETEPDSAILQEAPGPVESVSSRKEPVKVYSRDAEKRFGLTELMKPARYVRNRFEPAGESLVYDAATGLYWQRGGTRYPMNRQEAFAYVNHLNADQFEGFSDWRLPTVDELITILSESPEGHGHCVEPVFDSFRRFLWSSDRCTFLTAWYVNLEMGFVGYNDFSSFYYAKAVRTAQQSGK